MVGEEKKAYLIVRRNRKLSKYRTESTIFQDAPDTAKDELALARKTAIKYPVLMMIHEDGTAAGWNESEFWWPVLIAQKESQRVVFALEEVNGRLKRS